MGVVSGPDIQTDGLVFYVDPHNPSSYNSGSTDAYNLVSDNITGSLESGVQWSGSNFEFDGTDDVINFGTDANGVYTDMSWEAWVYPRVVSGFRNVIWSEGAGTTEWGICTNGNGIFFQWNGANSDSVSSGVFTLDTWHHLVCVFDDANNDLRVYINTDLVTTLDVSASSLVANSNALVKIGWRDSEPGSQQWNGFIGGVKIYNQQVTVSRINKNFNAHRKIYGL